MKFFSLRWSVRAIFLVYFIGLAGSTQLLGQANYQLSTKLDGSLLAGGIVGTTTSLILRNQHAPLTAAQVNLSQASEISSFDRSATNNYSLSFKAASDITLYTAYAFPLVALSFPEIRSDWLTLAVMFGEMVMLTETATGITKVLVGRARPYTYNPEVSIETRTQPGNNSSYFSGHTSYTASFSFFAAKVIADHTESKALKAVVWTTAVVWPAATGYFRYRAGQHFPTDVISGYVAGAAIGWLIPHLHRVKEPSIKKKVEIAHWHVSPTSFGVIVSL